MAGNRNPVPRFEWKMTKTYVQDAHKPWTGQIQGDYYVGAPEMLRSPGFEFEHGPVRIAMSAPEELRLVELPVAEAFMPDRPLGMSPHAPYRHPWGTETRGIPFYDYGYTYPPEDHVVVPDVEQRPVGMNELPVYFGAEFYGQLTARPPKKVMGIQRMVPRPDVPFWGWNMDEYQQAIGQPGIRRVSAPVRSSPMRPRRRLLTRQKPVVCMTPCYQTGLLGCVHDCPLEGSAVAVVPCSTPCYDTQAGSAPRTAYGVTKVIDNVVQENPESRFPEAVEQTAYNPDGAGIMPYGLSIPTISKFLALFSRKPAVYYGAHDCSFLRCGKGWTRKWSSWLKRCSCCVGPLCL